MATEYDRFEEPRRGRSFTRALLLILIAFIAGIVAMGYAFTKWDAIGQLLDRSAPPTAMSPQAMVPPQQPMTVVQEPLPETVVQTRLVELEQRIARIDSRTQAAAGNADRAEALLVAFAARRALDRGADLGYIESLLRDRFGGSQPRAVATIISASRAPVTLEELQSGLDSIAPRLAASSPDDSWWDGVRRELAGLIVVRKTSQPSTQPSDRLARARTQMGAGHVDLALAEVARLPGRAAAADWIEQARRYVTARAALDLIETAALLKPADRSVPPPAITEWPAPRRDPIETGAPGGGVTVETTE